MVGNKYRFVSKNKSKIFATWPKTEMAPDNGNFMVENWHKNVLFVIKNI